MSTELTTELELDMTPDTHMLFGQSSTSLGWKKCLAELIDNSFDAGALNVTIEYSNKSLSVSDNGRGGSDINAFFRMGAHRSRGGLGRYGVGLKDAAAWLWGTTEVRTVNGGRLYAAKVNWESVAKSNSWKLIATSTPSTSANGTIVQFHNIKHPIKNKESLLEEIGYLFSPAIRDGRQIVFMYRGKKSAVQPFQMPPLECVVDTESDVDGKRFRVTAGVVKEGHKNPKPGFSIAYKHRIITTTADGCGDFGTARFAGMVYLDESWQLARNKDELIDDAGLLAETLFQLCREPLEKASQQSICVELAGMENEISAALSEAMQEHIRQQRNKGNSKGTAPPKNTDRKQKRATSTQPGDKRLLAKIGSNIRVQFVDGLDGIGKADFNSSGTLISLNTDEPYVRWAKDAKDRNALVALAASILAIEAANIQDEKQRHRLLPEIDDEDMRARFMAGLSLYTKCISPERQDVTQ